MIPVTLKLHDPVVLGNSARQDVTELFGPTWRRSIRRVGGFWLGTIEVTAKAISRDWMDEMFEYGLLRELREIGSGLETWRGQVMRMDYTRKGDTFVRDASTIANAIRSIYTSIGDNLLTNGSGESGVWAAYNGPTNVTIVQDATWKSHGSYSIKITVTDTQIRGALVQATIAIVAGQQYLIRATLMVTSGSWRVSCNEAGTDTTLAFDSSRGETGDFAFEISIPETNTYSGNVDFRVSSEASAGVVNVDACVFQAGPRKAETGWYIDMDSANVHGRKEEILLRGGKSNDDANAECQGMLQDKAWCNPVPPNSAQTYLKETKADTLRLTLAGYWATLNWLYTTLHGTRACSAWVSALAALQSTYIKPGIIDANATDFYVDDRAPLRLGDVLSDVAQTGATGGAMYGIGVYAGRALNYEFIPQTLSYYRRDGKLYRAAGGEMDQWEPWLARPGWALLQDMPIALQSNTSQARHDPRWVFLEEVEMLAPSNDAPNGSLAFKLS